MKAKILNLCKKVLTACIFCSFVESQSMVSILFFGEIPYPDPKDYEN